MPEAVDPAPRLTLTEVAAAAASLLDSRIVEVRPVAGYVGNQDFLITATCDRYVLKAGDGEMLAAEAWACEQVRAHGVAAPRILATDLSGEHLGVALLVMQCLPGSPSPSVNHPAFVAAGRQLRRVHSISVDGFGPLRMDGVGSVLGEHASWEEFTETAHICIAELVAHRIMDIPFADDVRRALGPQHDAMRYDGPPVLLHGDLHPRHIFADDAGLTGVIDWGDVMAGDPYFDLARYSIGGQDSLADLLTGYGAVMSPELDRRFTLYRMIRMTRTLHDELRAGGDWFEAYRQQLRADLRLLPSLY